MLPRRYPRAREEGARESGQGAAIDGGASGREETEMAKYQEELMSHMSEYARTALGAPASGSYRAMTYAHILPIELRELNLIPAFRSEIIEHIRSNGIKLHQYFHHLNSSQAFAFNLFFPYFSNAAAAPVLA